MSVYRRNELAKMLYRIEYQIATAERDSQEMPTRRWQDGTKNLLARLYEQRAKVLDELYSRNPQRN